MNPETLTDALAETLGLFESTTPKTTTEVADALELGRRSTYDRLDRLVECGRLETKKVGGNGRVWWRPAPSEQREDVGNADDETVQFDRLVETVEEYAIFSLDPDGNVRSWNRGAERIKGYCADDVIGEHFSTFYVDGDRVAGVPERNLAAAAREGTVEDEGWRVRADGSEFWASVTITAIRDDAGDLDGFVKVTRDASERREREAQLRDQRDLTERVLKLAPVGVVTVQPDGTFTTVNRRAAELLGFEEGRTSASVGVRSVYDETGSFVPPEDRPPATVFETGEPVRNWHAQVELPDGGRRWISMNVEPVTDESGEVAEALLTTEDVTQLKEHAERLERQRDDLESELEQVFDRVEDGFFALDAERRVTYANAYARDLLDSPTGDVVDRYVWDVLDADAAVRESVDEALDRQEATTVGTYLDAADGWFELHLYPADDGLSVYVRDVTERKERESELRRYETTVETLGDGVTTNDEQGRFVMVNEAFCEMTGYDRREIVGETSSLILDEDARRRVAQLHREVVDGERDMARLEYDLQTADGGTIPVEARFGPCEFQDGTVGATGVIRDISERRERERDLERALDLLHRTEHIADVGGWEIDAETMDVYWSDHIFELLEVSADGEPPLETALDMYFETDRRALETAIEDAFENGQPVDVEARIRTDSGELRWLHVQGVPEVAEGEVVTLRGAAQDVTDRKQRERELERTLEMLDRTERVADVGGWEIDYASGTLFWTDNLFDILGVRDSEEPSLDEAIDVYVPNDRDRVREAIEQSVERVETFDVEARFERPDGSTGWLHSRGFPETDEDGSVVTLRGAAQDVTERKEYERMLEETNSELAALNSLNEVVTGITEAVIDQSTRERIEATVCDHLAAADPYRAAWIGDVESTGEAVTVRSVAGVEGSLDDEIAADFADEAARTFIDRAYRTGEMQTIGDADSAEVADPQQEEVADPWPEAVADADVSSAAAIPIVHEETVYAVLTVYADRPNAFSGEAGAVVAGIGEIVGHAIAATERKKALMSDELVELEFTVDDVFRNFDVEAATNGTVRLEGTVPVGDDEFVVYGTATGDSLDVVRAVMEATPNWESLTVRSEDSPTSFQVRATDPPILSAVAALGGYVDEAVIEEGDLDMCVHLAPSVDVRHLQGVIDETYPDATVVSRKQITRPRDDHRRFQRQASSDLTERQRAALDAAYHAGYFEWPRDTSGEEVAEALGIAPATFHHHIRKAQRKVLDSLYSSATDQSVAGPAD